MKNNLETKTALESEHVFCGYDYTNFAENAFCNAIATQICKKLEANQTGKTIKYKIAPFGDFKDGFGSEKIQRIDEGVCDALIDEFANNKNLPVFYGHPDYAPWRDGKKNIDGCTYGSIQNIEKGTDGIYANIKWFENFKSLPKKLKFSPLWVGRKIADKIYSPYKLFSLGLTQYPNFNDTSFANSKAINNNKGNPMKKEILLALGYSEDEAQKHIDQVEGAITEADILDKIKKLATARSGDGNEENKKKQLETELEAERTKLKEATEKFANEHKGRASDFIESLIEQGKLTKAEAESKVALLANSNDFDGTRNLLKELPVRYKIQGTQFANSNESLSAKSKFLSIVNNFKNSGIEHTEAWGKAQKENEALYDTAFNMKK